MIRKLGRTIAYTSISAGAFYVAIPDEEKSRFRQLSQASYRIANLVTTVGSIAVDYGIAISRRHEDPREREYDICSKQLKELQHREESLTFDQWNAKSDSELKLAQQKFAENKKEIEKLSTRMAELKDNSDEPSYFSRIHTRSAIKLKNMCVENKGVYIKLGQHLAMLDYLIPSEYQEVLTALLSKNPTSPWPAVIHVFKQDLGIDPEKEFYKIEHIPIASASLAQVHIAYSRTGEKYAIKVQHEDLLYGSEGDMKAITFIVLLLSKVFKQFDYNWLTKEMNRNLPEELNFKNEAKNIKTCTQYFQKEIQTGEVAIPKVIDHLTSQRILTMTFEEGCYVTDIPKIQQLGLQKHEIAHQISKIFCHQIYKHGFVHCDPHDANMLVRRNPYRPTSPQIVLLDHGLYRSLEPDFKYNYTRLWHSIITSNESEIRYYSEQLNAGETFTLLAAILTMKPWDDIVSKDMTRLRRKNTASEKEMLHSYAMKYFNEIVLMLGVLPSDLLLVLKTNDCLRHLDLKLGAPVNTTLVLSETIAEEIYKQDMNDVIHTEKGFSLLKKSIQIWIKWCNTMTRVMGLQFFSVLIEWNELLPAWLQLDLDILKI